MSIMDGPNAADDVMMEDILNDQNDQSMNIDSPDNVKLTDVNMVAAEKFCKDAARAFFNERGLISHQINSYNDFIDYGLQDLFDSVGEIIVEPGYDPSKKGGSEWKYASVTFGKVKVDKPTFWSGTTDSPEESLKLMPRHARLQHMTYSAQMKIEVRVQVYSHEKSDKVKSGTAAFIQKKILDDVKREIVIGRIPVMVKSKICWLHEIDKSDCLFDSGGYFLIKGAEKTFVAQEQRCLTRLWINDKPGWMVSYQAETKRKRVFIKLTDTSQAEGLHGGKVVNMMFLNASIPVWIMFFALGAESDKEVFEMIDIQDCDNNLVNIILATIKAADKDCSNFREPDNAKNFVRELIGSTKFPPSESFGECITTYMFPGVVGIKEKRLFLGYMIKCLLLSYFGKRKIDNVNDFRNKRLELAGELLRRELWANIKHAEKRMVRALQRDLYGDRQLQYVERYIDASIITNGINRAFSTGNWCHAYKKSERTSGVVATLRRTNPLQMMSDLRKTRWQVSYAGKAGDSRYPNPSYWGKLCFLSTPDGENCGLVKNLAVTAIVSSKVTEPFINKLVPCGMEVLDKIPLSLLRNVYKVFLNGDWIGVCEDSDSFVRTFREMRRKKQIHSQVEIKRDEHLKEVRMFSDAGRLLRPLLIVENLRKIVNLKGGVQSFQYLVDEEIIEFVGVEEEEECRTAWGIKQLLMEEQLSQQTGKVRARSYTHCELDLSFLLGLSCGLIPFANHNLAKRVLFEAEKHSQQAIGYSTLNPMIRVDTLSHQLYYPQRPLFRTMLADSLGKADHQVGVARPEYFNGQNAIVAVNVHLGYNQEDSLVMNRSSLDRGMFRTELLKSYKAEVENPELTKIRKPKDKVEFGKMQSKKGRVDNLDDDGFPYIGASLQSGDMVIGKVSESGEDYGIKLKHTEKGMVQKVVLSANDEGKNFAAVTLRQVRAPCVGDKFSSMHGQKGVIGFLESQENFPFTCLGIVPDIVINPHAFPTRQTPGQLLEAAFGKGIACGGAAKYATPFTTPSVEVISEQLHRAGYQRWGSERVLNGRTGEMVKSLIFMGPNFYQRLIHMAEDKVKFRNTGPVHPVTRQPVADRKRFGGVKFGEMERDCMLAHGAAANLHERLFVLSDFSQMHICQSCNRVANVIQRPTVGGKKIRGPYCLFCESAENIVRVNVPYGAKLLYQELFCMGICLKFETELC